MRKILLIVGIWLLPFIFIFAWPRDFPTVVCLAKMSFPLMGLSATVYFIVGAIRGTQKRATIAGLILTVILISAGYFFGFNWGAQLHLLTNQSRYQATIDKLKLAKSESEKKEICGEHCQILSADPLRVGFHYCHCFLNWNDIIYDPTGILNDSEVIKSRRLNIYLYDADRLKGDWYLGKFGD